MLLLATAAIASAGAADSKQTASGKGDGPSLTLRPNEPATIKLESPLDDEDLGDPRGYSSFGAQPRRWVRRVIVENVGTSPLEEIELIANGHDWRTAATLRASLNLPPDPGLLARGFFRFWIDHRVHASSGLKAAEDPVSMLRFWGYTLCGEDTKGLARFLATHGIAARPVELNGHVAAEYSFDGKWNMLDGDQNIAYLNLDNRTLASAEDIRRDPFLAVRTKPFGKHALPNLTHARYNAALFAYVAPRERKPFKFKASRAAPALRDTLLPGERLIFHFDQAPAHAVGSTNLAAWRGVKEATLGTVEKVLGAAGRIRSAGSLRIESAHPIVQVVNHATGQTVAPAPGSEPVFEVSVPVSATTDQISLFAQRSLISFPRPRKGQNTFELRATGSGLARVTFELNDLCELPPPPEAKVLKVQASFHDPAPRFTVGASDQVDKVWWQIAGDEQFEFVPPNFDQVQPAAEEIALDPLTATFFNPSRPYFIRIKARSQGVWGAWSSPVRFLVEKPAAPESVTATSLPDGKLRLAWKGADAEEYLIFGSNRLDFLPEIYAPDDIVSMVHVRPEQTRPNKNLIHTVRGTSAAEFFPTTRFHRVIARGGAAFSTPSALIPTPDVLARSLPPATVLEVRAAQIADPRAPNGYRDEYRAEERELPGATAARLPSE